MVCDNGYDFYKCDSNKGLGSYNKDKYIALRTDFNNATNKDCWYYIMFYVVVVYAFNNQIRFNSKGEFNVAVNKRDFNKNMQNKLSIFIDRIKQQNCKFTCLDFREFDISTLNKNDFVYVDPPYLISCAVYNEQGGWEEKDERDLLNYLDKLDSKNIRFALSNVLKSKSKENKILSEWANKYKVINLDYNYSNANYHKKNKTIDSDNEVLIINY